MVNIDDDADIQLHYFIDRYFHQYVNLPRRVAASTRLIIHCEVNGEHRSLAYLATLSLSN